MSRLLRSPDILVGWDAERLFVKDLAGQREILSSPEIVSLLDLFGEPRTPAAAADLLPEYERASILRSVRRLAAIGLLLPEKEGRRRLSRLRTWKGNLASAQYHVACRDPRYLVRPAELDRYLRDRVATRRRPPRFKRYPAAPGVMLPSGRPRSAAACHFDKVLGARRTTREFARRPVLLEDFAALLRGTWGKTGELDTEHLGKLTTKTSPSAGALHPIECYALVSNVRGLASGLYHYEVERDELRRLRAGPMRTAAVRAASGQSWVGRAAFLCVMTAVFERTLWKYRIEAAYRVLWLEAGHLAQTFCLLAASRGLGSFVGDTLQDSAIEELIGLDGVREFPVYLCGAGVPGRENAAAKMRTAKKT
ncbi:MAG: SagB family peptide dehydrogenase [Thermoanaerobaculia bacterium]